MALDRVALILKRGDNGEYRDGMVIDIIDEAAWGKPLENIISPFCSKVYLPTIVDRKFLLMKDIALGAVYDGAKPTATTQPVAKFIRGVKMDYAHLESALGISGLKDRVHSTESVGLLDATRLGEADWIKIDSLPADPVKDLMAITSGSYTIGAAKNYATIALWGADIGNLTGNLTGTVEAAVTETAQTSINKSYAGNTLTLTSNSDHLGRFGGGNLITHSLVGAHLIALNGTGTAGASINISLLNIKTTGVNAAVPYATVMLTSLDTDIISQANNILIDCDNKGHSAFYVETGGIARIFNCMAANPNPAIGVPYGLVIVSAHISSRFENNTIRGFVTGFRNFPNAAYAVKSMAVFDCTNCYMNGAATAGLGNTAASKCASSDATGSEAGLRNMVAANEFISTNLADATALAPVSTGTLADGGTAPGLGWNAAGIEGNPRPHGLLYSIGAHELDSAPTITGLDVVTGPTAGGTAVTITGTNFFTGATVTFGGVAAVGVTVVNATSITCTTPAGAAGAANVVVTNADAQTVTSVGAFTYAVPPVPPTPPVPPVPPSPTTATALRLNSRVKIAMGIKI